MLDAAYLYYYATETAFESQAEESGVLKRRLEDLIKDALIIADRAKFDVFNALTLMDNVPLLESLKVGDVSNCGCPDGLRRVSRSSVQAMVCLIITSTTGGLAHWPVWKVKRASSLEKALGSL